MSALYFDARIDGVKLQNDIAKINRQLSGMSGNFEKEGGKIDNITRRMAQGLAAYFSVFTATNLVKDIARVSKMRFFTSEICLDLDGHFYTVDYINADPDMNPRSFYANGVPDEVVRHIVWLLVIECMRIIMKGRGYFDVELDGSDIDFRVRQPIPPKSQRSKASKPE